MSVRVERRNREIVEPDAPLPARARRDCDLDGRKALEGLVVGWPPREGYLPLLASDGLPILWKLKVWSVRPPHVLTGGVDHLELERVGRRVALDGERELVVGRQGQSERTMDHHVTAMPVKIEIHSHRSAVQAVRIRVNRHLDSIRGSGGPLTDRVEGIQYYSSGRGSRDHRSRRGSRGGRGLCVCARCQKRGAQVREFESSRLKPPKPIAPCFSFV